MQGCSMQLWLSPACSRYLHCLRRNAASLASSLASTLSYAVGCPFALAHLRKNSTRGKFKPQRHPRMSLLLPAFTARTAFQECLSRSQPAARSSKKLNFRHNRQSIPVDHCMTAGQRCRHKATQPSLVTGYRHRLRAPHPARVKLRGRAATCPTGY